MVSSLHNARLILCLIHFGLLGVFFVCFFFLFPPQRDSEKKKKEEGQRTRPDKQLLLDMLFSAFERHQYYNIKDLVDLTKQPVVRAPARPPKPPPSARPKPRE